MSTEHSLEQRLAALEREVAEIRLRLGSGGRNGNWVDAIAGSMKEYREFEEVVKFGREFRKSADGPKK